VLLQRKKFESAESDFRTALSLSPNEGAYMKNIGLALHRRGKRKEAAEWFRMAADRDPKFAISRSSPSRSSRLGVWLGGFVILATVGHLLEVGFRGGPNSQVFAYIGSAVLVATVPVILLRYWLRRRSPAPDMQAIYEAQSRRSWWSLHLSTIVRYGGVIVLLSGFVYSFLYLKDIRLTYVFVFAAVIWARGWEIWRFAGRIFQRN
jgi:tetratricopeptide (TPR) repeat protein